MASAGNFDGRPFRLEERSWVVQQDYGNNRSLLHGELWIIKNSAASAWSNAGSAWNYSIAGQGASGGFTYDFRNSDSLLLYAVDVWIGHDGNGYLDWACGANCTADQLGYAATSSSYSAPRIPKAPNAPFVSYAGNITTTNIRIGLTSTGDNGAGIDSWDFQVSENAAFTQGVFTRNWGGGLLDITGLVPGRQYWFRGRAHNSQGWGAWSPVNGPYRTLAAMYMSDGDSWNPVQVQRSTGTAWVGVEVQYSTGSAWVSPLSN